MMVELIPKQEQKPIFGQVFFLIISFLMLVSVTTAFFVLKLFVRDTRETLQTLEKTFIEDTQPLEEEVSAKIEGYKNKTEMLRVVLDQRKGLLPLFEVLEQTTHPDVFFTSLNGDVKTGVFVFEGEAQDFFALEQQRLIWDAREEFTSTLHTITLNETGAGNFEVEFMVKPEFLRPL